MVAIVANISVPDVLLSTADLWDGLIWPPLQGRDGKRRTLAGRGHPKGHARKERVLLFGTDQRITSGPAAIRPHSKAEDIGPERFADSQIPIAPRGPSIGALRKVHSPLTFGAQQRVRSLVARRLGLRHDDARLLVVAQGAQMKRYGRSANRARQTDFLCRCNGGS
jgi:hypothetical protein